MRRQHQYAGGANEKQAGANVTTTTGSCRENNRQLLYKHSRKGTNTPSEQLDDALVRRKKDFIIINSKKEKFKKNV
jgi:ribosomal protein L36